MRVMPSDPVPRPVEFDRLSFSNKFALLARSGSRTLGCRDRYGFTCLHIRTRILVHRRRSVVLVGSMQIPSKSFRKLDLR